MVAGKSHKHPAETHVFRRRDGNQFGARVVVLNIYNKEYGMNMFQLCAILELDEKTVHQRAFTPQDIQAFKKKIEDEYVDLRLDSYREIMKGNFKELKRTFTLIDTKTGQFYSSLSRLSLAQKDA